MTYTIITEDGLIMYREDIFATEAAAYEFVQAHPYTPKGTLRQYVADTETALLIQSEVKAARERHERALDVERRELTSRLLLNASL